ncbi:MAG: hypothetical protein GY822_09650 [Deltaproteobacteria bacterium]|nr:hypothetical protein [Deltaproteobacteria bacterium]
MAISRSNSTPANRATRQPTATATTTAATATTTANAASEVSGDNATNRAAGLANATFAGNAPLSLNQVLGGGGAAAGMLGQLAGQAFQSRGTKDIFGLIPGRVPNAVGLDVVLAKVAASPDGKAAIAQLAQQISKQTGMQIPPSLVAAAQANPDRVAGMLQFTPAEMSAGMKALNQAHQNGSIEDVPERKNVLPKHFDFGAMDKVDFVRKEPAIKELAPGLFSRRIQKRRTLRRPGQDQYGCVRSFSAPGSQRDART